MRTATQRGYDGTRIIEVGEDVPDHVPQGSWMTEAPKRGRSAKVEAEAPETEAGE